MVKSQPRALSYDTCARINALIKYANVTVLCPIPGHKRMARVRTVQPSEHPGYLFILCHDVVGGECEIEQGIDVHFQLILEH